MLTFSIEKLHNLLRVHNLECQVTDFGYTPPMRFYLTIFIYLYICFYIYSKASRAEQWREPLWLITKTIL